MTQVIHLRNSRLRGSSSTQNLYISHFNIKFVVLITISHKMTKKNQSCNTVNFDWPPNLCECVSKLSFYWQLWSMGWWAPPNRNKHSSPATLRNCIWTWQLKGKNLMGLWPIPMTKINKNAAKTPLSQINVVTHQHGSRGRHVIVTPRLCQQQVNSIKVKRREKRRVWP